MLRRIDATAHAEIPPMPRAEHDVDAVLERARPLVDDVRQHGAEALTAQAERFDGVRPPSLVVSAADLARSLDALDPAVRSALETAIARVRQASGAQVPTPTSTTLAPGAIVEQRWLPVARAGVYVPGGKAVYPSSVVMNVVAAQVAGVERIVVASPPQSDHGGLPHPTILAAAALLGIDTVLAAGGAGAIAALAYGVPGVVDAVDVVTGPGNVYVAAAKRLVAGHVRVDAEAGPTEILVIADASADPDLVAADLVSQAEHDELAAAVLVTDSAVLADAVDAALERRAAATPNAARVREALGGEQSATILVTGLDHAIAVSDAYAPEHLEIMTTDDDAVVARIRNAGAIFLGPHSPVSVGDYAAGSNHVLPTGGQAARVSGLGAMTFLRSQQVVRYDARGLAGVADAVVELALAEQLPAHAEAIRARS